MERKAHMNIHDTIEVVDNAEVKEPNTRDRFGKYHPVPRTETSVEA
jgi:hypothetical protein